jgi:small subunit ribosomal protein S26e
MRGEAEKFVLSKKRKSRGRAKGGKGHSELIHCSNCGAAVPRDKAKKVTKRTSLVEPSLARELRAAGAYIASPTQVAYYCVSCAVHYGIVKVRAKSERRSW